MARVFAVADVLDELPYLTHGELLALASAQKEQQIARRAAWRRVEEAATWDGGRDLDRLRAEVGAWATRLGAIVGDEAGTGLVDLTLADARRDAAPTILDAAVALLYQDELSEPDRAVLLEPWLSIVAR